MNRHARRKAEKMAKKGNVIDLKDVHLTKEGKQVVKNAQNGGQGQPYIIGNEQARLAAFNQELDKLLDAYQVVLKPILEIEPGSVKGAILAGIRKEKKADA